MVAKSLGDRVFNAINHTFLILVALVCVVPVLYVIAVSITPINEVMKNGGYVLIPQEISFAAYKELFTKDTIPRALMITLSLAIFGTFLNLVITALMAYPLSRKGLPGRGPLLLAVFFTMLFSGGLIPTYLIVKETGLLNTYGALIVPALVGTFQLLVMKSFFETIPEELFESARMDGAQELKILYSIVLPLSVPALITVGLFYMVGHWNEIFRAIMYITNSELYPLQVVIRSMLIQSADFNQAEVVVPTMTLQMAAVMIASIPVIVFYPFVQKHLTKGMLIGAIKG
ncbi:carbohydrate ABC transporter permease [Paenibacillus sp. PL2-23]|uniref:carbohydrate ABC transporter permease n=1 Tax=Paenibacillus sp. PL2-23 TaxID=2100729 RepID=UPI0030F6355D